MGRRKKEAAQMGKALIKDRFRGKKSRGGDNDSFLHTTEMNDGYDGRVLNLQSVTEQSSMEDFLLTAEMAGRDFTAERSNVQLVTPQLTSGVLSKDQQRKVQDKQNLFKNLLRIPRRPPWSKTTPADKLRLDEHMTFLEWRRQLGKLQEEEHIVITPYEKNLDFWRQLWRVIERSDVVVQIVDARNPLLFWCPDLDSYVKEVDSRKRTVLLINKADLLTVRQRETWAEYFAARGIQIVFWSAVEETARIEREKMAMKELAEKAEGMDSLAEDVQAKTDLGSSSDTCEDSGEENRDSGELSEETGLKHTDFGSPQDDREVTAETAGTQNDGEVKAHLVGNSRDNTAETDKEDFEGTSTESAGIKKDGENEANSKVSEEVDIMVADIDTDTAASTNKQCERDSLANEAPEAEDVSKDEEEEDSDGYETIEEDTDEDVEEDLMDGPMVRTAVCDRLGGQETVASGVGGGANRTESAHAAQSGFAPTEFKASSTSLQNSDELLALLRSAARTQHQPGVTTVGMVGYPNVGKSSTINAILQTKKVPVSATPGRTKHFQTLFVEKDLMLCDCPGLVFPSFVNSKAELVVNGILPIDQLQDSEPPVELVCHRVGRRALETLYGITLPPPETWEDADAPPKAYDVLHAYGMVRGFMSHKGNPDRPRAARYILKDFVNGKLLFCHPPPGVGVEPEAFQKPPFREPSFAHRPTKVIQKTGGELKDEALNKEFLMQLQVRAHAQGPKSVKGYVRTEALKQVGSQGQGVAFESSTPDGSQASLVGKPWKKHHNRNKKEKLRKVYASHDVQ